MDRFDILAARRAHGALSEGEADELRALVRGYPKLGQRLEEMEEMSVLMAEFSPLLEAMDDAPAASFPEHRMGQFTSAVWQEFRPQVPQRRQYNVWSFFGQHAFSLTATLVLGALLVGTTFRKPEKILLTTGEGPQATTRVIEFGVYNPVTELDYAPDQLLHLLNVDTQTFLSSMDKLNAMAAAPTLKPLSFEMPDAFEQWKADALSKETLARVWVDPNMDRLYIMQREGEQTVQDLPQDSELRDQMIRDTIRALSREAASGNSAHSKSAGPVHVADANKA